MDISRAFKVDPCNLGLLEFAVSKLKEIPLCDLKVVTGFVL